MIQEEPIFFEDLALSDDVLDALYDMRFEKCKLAVYLRSWRAEMSSA